MPWPTLIQQCHVQERTKVRGKIRVLVPYFAKNNRTAIEKQQTQLYLC
jgi:c-di-GMP-binding flagellar brake protein YcgR